MLIGVDFDNTLAGYDRIFLAAAKNDNLVAGHFSGSRDALRVAIRELPDGETAWMRLQGQVYGALMDNAEMIEGASEFLHRCRAAGIAVCVVSHKTEFGHFDARRVSLRTASRQWMERMGFFDPEGFGLSPERVFFETTRHDKLMRIAAIGCTHFIDDLEEVLVEPAFPPEVARYLLARDTDILPVGPFKAFRRWHDISEDVFANGR